MPTAEPTHKKLSLLVPCYNEAEALDQFFDRVLPIVGTLEGAHALDWEIVCVNDGSRDNTLAILRTWHQKDHRIKVINLARNFGKERALTAALDLASGDAIIPMDADLQDPPELIPDMVALWQQGFDVVNAVRESRDSDTYLKRTTARLFYRFINAVSDVPIPRDVGDYRLLSRRVCDSIRSMRETHRFMKGLFAWVGYPTTSIQYKRPPRSAGTSKWNYWRLWNFALEGIISFSTAPLKLASYLGLATASSSLLYALYLVIRTLIYGDPVRGYPSTMAVILFLGGVQLLFIGIIGEYTARIHEETKGRPIYIIESTQGLNPDHEKN